MARKKDANSNGKSQQQQYIEGTAPPRIPELDAAAEKYEEGRDERMEASKIEVERKTKLIELMHKFELKQYVIPGTDPPREIVLIPEGETVKVRAFKVREAGHNLPVRPGDPLPPVESAQLSDEERDDVNDSIDQVADGVAS